MSIDIIVYVLETNVGFQCYRKMLIFQSLIFALIFEKITVYYYQYSVIPYDKLKRMMCFN